MSPAPVFWLAQPWCPDEAGQPAQCRPNAQPCDGPGHLDLTLIQNQSPRSGRSGATAPDRVTVSCHPGCALGRALGRADPRCEGLLDPVHEGVGWAGALGLPLTHRSPAGFAPHSGSPIAPSCHLGFVWIGRRPLGGPCSWGSAPWGTALCPDPVEGEGVRRVPGTPEAWPSEPVGWGGGPRGDRLPSPGGEE